MINSFERQRAATGMDAGGGVYDVDAIAALLAGGKASGRVPGTAMDAPFDRALDRAIGNALDTAMALAKEGGPDSLREGCGRPGARLSGAGYAGSGIAGSGYAGAEETEPGIDGAGYDGSGIAGSGVDGSGVAGSGVAGSGVAGSGIAGSDAEGAEGDIPEIPMPAGWDVSLWQCLGPEVRAAINAGEQAHAQAMARVRAEWRAERQLQDAFAVAANAQIQQALATMKQIVEGEYGAVDWQDLARRDPAAYVRLQQACNARMAAIRRVQQGVEQQTRLYEARRAAQARQAVAEEFAVVQPEIRAMLGAAFNGRQFAEDVARYMQEQGCPDEVINNLSRGYELKLVAKAMLYDRLQAQRAAAARKLAQAPAVQPPRGLTPSGSHSRARQALSRLNRNPNSTDALAALFEATM